MPKVCCQKVGTSFGFDAPKPSGHALYLTPDHGKRYWENKKAPAGAVQCGGTRGLGEVYEVSVSEEVFAELQNSADGVLRFDNSVPVPEPEPAVA